VVVCVGVPLQASSLRSPANFAKAAVASPSTAPPGGVAPCVRQDVASMCDHGAEQLPQPKIQISFLGGLATQNFGHRANLGLGCPPQ